MMAMKSEVSMYGTIMISSKNSIGTTGNPI